MAASLTPHAFVQKGCSSTLKERFATQEHFIDLCYLVSHPTPAETDPTGSSFTMAPSVARKD